MRKGIISLSSLGRGKKPVRRKTKNMALAEQAARKAETPEPEKPQSNDKPYVQTIMVPKKRTNGTKKGAVSGKKHRTVTKK